MTDIITKYFSILEMQSRLPICEDNDSLLISDLTIKKGSKPTPFQRNIKMCLTTLTTTAYSLNLVLIMK